MAEFSEYDHGFRLGTFDKCNGRTAPRVEESGDIFSTGYYDGWLGNEAKIDEPTEQQLMDAAFEAGQAYANEVRPILTKKANHYNDYSDYFYDGFMDLI